MFDLKIVSAVECGEMTVDEMAFWIDRWVARTQRKATLKPLG